MKYESHFLNPEQSKTSIRSRIPNKIDLYTYIFVFYLILKMQIQVSFMLNLNTKVRFVGIKSNLPDYPIIFFFVFEEDFSFCHKQEFPNGDLRNENTEISEPTVSLLRFFYSVQQ